MILANCIGSLCFKELANVSNFLNPNMAELFEGSFFWGRGEWSI